MYVPQGGEACDLKIPFGLTNVITSGGMGRGGIASWDGLRYSGKGPDSLSKRNSLHKISAQTSGCERNRGVCTPFFTTMRPLTLVTSLSDLGTHPAQEDEQMPTVSLDTASGLLKAMAPVFAALGRGPHFSH